MKKKVESTKNRVEMDILKIAVIVIVVIVVIAVIGLIWKLSRRSDDSRSSNSGSSENEQSQSTFSSSENERFHARSERGQSRYTVTRGKLVEEETPVQAAAAQPQNQQHEFPRHAAQSGNMKHLHRQLVNQGAPEKVAEEPRFEVTSESARVVNVARLADLFSVKRSVEAEFGISEEEMEKMVAAYNKKSEYRERRLPVNQHFNLEDYKDSKKVMRESANAASSFKGSKRGNITGDVYRAYGKNATRNRIASNADVISMDVDADRHEAHLAKIRERRANGYLEVRT